MFPAGKLYVANVWIITTAQLHLTKPLLRFCASSNPARSQSKICDVENL